MSQDSDPQNGSPDPPSQPNVSSPLVWSILTTLFCFLPTGIISIVYASKVNSLLASGAIRQAQKAASAAKMWAMISCILGIFSILLLVLVELFLLAVQSTRNVARDVQNNNHFRMIAVSMQAYSDAYSYAKLLDSNYSVTYDPVLPAAYTVNEDGKPLHSWRVAILPYIAQEELYKQIHLDEPWDSEWNKQFHDKCPKCYQNPNADLSPSQTTYAVVVGENTAFPGSKGVSLFRIKDGRTHTGMVTERSPVCWMDPNSDIPFEEAIKGVNVSPNGIRSYFIGRFTVVTCDGVVYRLNDSASGDFLRKLFDSQDGEDVDMSEYAR